MVRQLLVKRRISGAVRRLTTLGVFVLSLGVLLANVLPIADVQAASPSVELSAPKQIKLGEPIQIKLAVQNAADVAGYEANLEFDSSVVELNGVSQRHAGDLKAQGRDVQALGPVERPNEVSFGMYSCPVANCVDGASSRHDRGASGHVQLAVIELAAHQPGTVEVRFGGAHFVDDSGNTLAVRGGEQTLRVQVGGASNPLYAVPAATLETATVGHTPSGQAGPFDLEHRGVVGHADAIQVALAWTEARQQGVVCGPTIDPKLDVNHDGCLDVADAQLIASNYSGAGVKPTRPAASAALSAESTDDSSNADMADQTAASTDAAVPLLAAGSPVVFTVNSAGSDDDASPGDGVCLTSANTCTLRAAIDEINAESGLGNTFTVNFNIPGAGVHTISTNPSLPAIVMGNVTINGYSQPGASPNTDPLVSNAHILIQLQGAGADSSTFTEGITLTSANNVVRGLALFDYHIAVSLFGLGATNNQILGDYVGVDATGNNGASGLLPGQAGGGVDIDQGAAHNVVGTPSLADRNIISGNSVHGVVTNAEDTDFNVIQNNIVGLAPDGRSARPNFKHGVTFKSQSSFNLAGGTGANQRNVISGNVIDGVELAHDTLTVNNQVIGNFIGTDVTGNASPAGFGNQTFGVEVHDGVTNNVVSNNVIGGNVLGGIDVRDFAEWGNQIINNSVGVGANGSMPVPNQAFGIEVTTNADNVTIGPGNVVANNPIGVQVANDPNPAIPPSFGVTITRNSTFNNQSVGTSCGTAGLGIGLGPVDPCNPHTTSSNPPTANRGMLPPKLNAANTSTADATTCANCVVEVFVADSPAAPAGATAPAGQGKTFVGSGTADGSGHALISLSGVNVGTVLTATSTDTQGDTSEFATNIAAGSGTLSTPTTTPIPTPTNLIALDNFNRQEINGWGTADIGGTWAVEEAQRSAGQAASDYAVNNGSATMIDRTADIFNSAYLTNVSAQNVDVSFGVKTDQLTPSGGLSFAYFVARRVHSGVGSEYLGRIHFNADNSVGMQAAKTVPCSTGFCLTLIGSPVGVTGLTHRANGLIRVRGQVLTVNSTTTEIRLKAWADGQAEPAAWVVDVTDNEPSLQGQSGSVGVHTAWTGAAPASPLTFTFQNFQVAPIIVTLPTPTPTSGSSPSNSSSGSASGSRPSSSSSSSSGGGGGQRGGGGGGGVPVVTGAAGGGAGAPGSQPAATQPASAAPQPVGQAPITVAGVQAVGPEVQQTIGPEGGQVSLSGTGLTLTIPAEAMPDSPVVVDLQQVNPGSLPGLPNGFGAGLTGVQLRLFDASGAPLDHLQAPLLLSYSISSDELALTEGQASRLHWMQWSGSSWQAIPCNTSGSSLDCTLANAGLLATAVAPISSGPLDWDIDNGHFFSEANGFGGGSLGYTVVDDSDAAMWTEFQRLGGVQQVGYPISGRFQYKGFLTQAFQRLALQWRPDLNQAVPVNVFDELSARGADAWLDSQRQVPPPGDTADEAGLSFDEVLAKRGAMLDPYPDLSAFYQNTPDALDLFGVPVAVKNYGPVVVVRLQRATLQLWTVDTSFAAQGTVIAGNGADIAKEVGLWPSDATTPQVPPGPPPNAGGP